MNSSLDILIRSLHNDYWSVEYEFRKEYHGVLYRNNVIVWSDGDVRVNDLRIRKTLSEWWQIKKAFKVAKARALQNQSHDRRKMLAVELKGGE